MRATQVLVAAAVAAALACAIGVLAGSSGFGVASADIVWSIRVPRVLAGFGAGAALGLAGALMQLLTRNALADPYVLGVAGGASVGALGAMLLAGAAGAQATEWGVAGGAAFGAAAASALLFGLLWRRLASTAIVPSGEGATALEELFTLRRQGKLRVVDGPRYPLAEAARAQAELAARRTSGKVVLEVGEGR